MRIAYCGYDFFYTCLKRLLKMETVEVIRVFTFDTDNQYNYNKYVTKLAEENQIPITTRKISEQDVRELFLEYHCDCIVTAGYLYRIPVVNDVGFRGVNIHPTLLPQGRGRWPLPFVILKGLDKNGVTLHKINDQFDEGDILLQRSFPVNEREDLETLSCRCQMMAEQLVETVFSDFERYWENAVPQTGGEYWDYPTLEEMSFDFSMSVKEIDRVIRAYGKFDSCVRFAGKDWLVWDANCWHENHNYQPGTIVHTTNKEYLIAAKDGFVCLRFYEEDKSNG